MEECVKCHRSEEEARLFDVIDGSEIAKMCERCALIEDIPIIKKPTTSQLKEAEKNYSVYQRLKRMAGLEKKEEKHETILDRIKMLDEHPELEMPERKSINIIHNFHWYIMRARRTKGLSQRQLAMLLGESEEAVKMIEKGQLPGEPEILIKKLEQFFQIKLRERTEREIEEEKRKFRESSYLKRRALEKEEREETSERKDENIEFEEPISEVILGEETEEDIVSSVASGKVVSIETMPTEKTPARVLSFKPEALKNLTIDDLKRIKEAREKIEKFPEEEKENSSLYKRDLGEKEKEAEEIVREAREEEKRKQELRERIADEMKREALGKKTEIRKSTLDRKELLKKRDYVPSISELAAKKREREQMKLVEKSGGEDKL